MSWFNWMFVLFFFAAFSCASEGGGECAVQLVGGNRFIVNSGEIMHAEVVGGFGGKRVMWIELKRPEFKVSIRAPTFPDVAIASFPAELCDSADVFDTNGLARAKSDGKNYKSLNGATNLGDRAAYFTLYTKTACDASASSTNRAQSLFDCARMLDGSVDCVGQIYDMDFTVDYHFNGEVVSDSLLSSSSVADYVYENVRKAKSIDNDFEWCYGEK